jgi:purine-binding chemotaxis protein CheW
MVRQLTTFTIGESVFGIDVLLMREINRVLDITPVRPAPGALLGLINLRGQIVSIVDPGIPLGLGKRELSGDARCIVLKTAQEVKPLVEQGLIDDEVPDDVTGVLVDAIGDMISVDSADIVPPPANVNGVDARFLSGVVRLEEELVATLRLGEILKLNE